MKPPHPTSAPSFAVNTFWFYLLYYYSFGFWLFQNEISSHPDFLSAWPHWHLRFALIIQLQKLSNLFIQAIKALNAWIYHHLKSPVTVIEQK